MHSAQIRVEKSMDAMGSAFSIVLYSDDSAKMERAIDAAFSEVDRVEALLSNFQPESEWSLVNRQAVNQPVRVSAELFALLCRCLEYSRRSDGAFDISVGPLVKAWGFHRHDGAVPRPDESVLAHSRVGYGFMHLDSVSQTVRLERPGMEIDPGGIGKGYAVDRVVSILRGRGFHTALIAASRSTIYGMGAPPSERRGWPVMLRNPANPAKPAGEVFLKDMSVSTSGSGENSFAREDRVYSHIIDPRSGEPADDVLVAVLAPQAMDSEAWTKPCLLNGPAWAARNPIDGGRVLYFERAARLAPRTCSANSSAALTSAHIFG